MKKVILYLIIVLLFLNCGNKKKPFILLPNLTDTQQNLNNFQEVPVTINDDNQNLDDSQNTQNTSNQDNLTANIDNNHTYSEVNFNFNTNHTIELSVTVSDVNGPVSNANVNITDPNLMDTILFQGITNENGIVSGSIAVPTSVESLNLNVIVGDNKATQTLSLSNESQVLTNINSEVIFNQDVDNYIAEVIDLDGDGVSDLLDSFPEDPSLATKIVIPNLGTAVVSYEDLYPSKGDADFNDLVLEVTNEEYLNSQGKVVKIKGKYKILARGAGYTHTVLLNLPGKGVYNGKVYDASNQILQNISANLDSFQQLPIFIKNNNYFQNKNLNTTNLYFSNEMCSGMCNVYANTGLIQTYSSEIEVIFDEPMDKEQLALAPYDLYIYVLNTRNEIHLPGFYFKPDGKDKYLDNEGFPWVLIVPVEWNWPLERKNIVNAYPYFDDWYLSNGQEYKNWYQLYDDNAKKNQFLYYNIQGGIANFLLQFGYVKNFVLWLSLAILTTGVLVFLFIKGRNPYQLQ